MYTKKSLHGIISVHFHQRRSEFGQKLTKFDPKSWNQKESVQESIQESKRIGFSSQHQPPEPKNPSLIQIGSCKTFPFPIISPLG